MTPIVCFPNALLRSNALVAYSAVRLFPAFCPWIRYPLVIISWCPTPIMPLDL